MAKNSAIGPSTSAGKNVSAPTTRMVPSQNVPNFKRVGTQGAARRRHRGFRRQRSGHRHHEDDRRIAAEQDDDAGRQIVPRRIAIQSGEGGAIVGGGSGEGVEHFGIAVHRRIAHRRDAVGRDH